VLLTPISSYNIRTLFDGKTRHNSYHQERFLLAQDAIVDDVGDVGGDHVMTEQY